MLDAINQKLRYHAKKNGYLIRKSFGYYYIFDRDKKPVNQSPMTFEQLKKTICKLAVDNLKADFGVN